MQIFESDSRFIHEWIYDIVCTVSYDRDYIYRSYTEHFHGIMSGIFNGFALQSGEYRIMGLKSDYDADISWELQHRVNYMGLNSVRMRCKILDKHSDRTLETHMVEYELSNGERIS
jgi:hypothetical protein